MKAFPTTNWQSMAPLGTGYDEGMDLRDYFAAKAMQGLIHDFNFEVFRDDPKRLAAWAYDAADAMMEVREK